LLLVGPSLPAFAQNGELVWAKRAGSNSIDEGQGVAVDADRNVYVTGYFKLTATFGPGEANQTMLTALVQDVFVAKYDPDGELLWVRQVKGFGWGTSIAVDGDGNCYVFGYFGSTLTFDDGQPGEVVLTPLGQDVFLAKYDADGDFIWATKAGGSLSEFGFGIAVDSSGNSYVTGRYGSNPVTFGAGEPNETMLAGLGGNNGEDIFVAKYDTDGMLQWAKSAGGANGNSGADIDVDAAGNSYVTGRFSGTATFGPGEANETVLMSPLPGANDEIFIAKYDPDGNLLWVRDGAGTAQNDRGEGIAVDGDGNSYATGTYRTLAPFGGQLNPTQLASSGLDDIFVVKHDTDGNLEWVKMVVGAGIDFSLGLDVDAFGSSYITGHTRGGQIFGAEEANETALGGGGAEEIFVARYDPDGLLQWAKLAGGSSDDRGRAVAVDSSGGVLVTGHFGQTATFGSGEANQTALMSAGNFDIFVAKFQRPAECGDADGSGAVNASDALIALLTGVGSGSCPLCICDVNSSGAINATDALLILQDGVGQPVVLVCIAC
jgi:hypothetical protein